MVQNRVTISGDLGDEAILAELGARLADERLRRNRTQAELAEEAGVSRSTVRRLEAGESTQLGNLVRMLRVLGLARNLDALLPTAVVSPLERLAREGKPRRQRASTRGRDDRADSDWTWGEDR